MKKKIVRIKRLLEKLIIWLDVGITIPRKTRLSKTSSILAKSAAVTLSKTK